MGKLLFANNANSNLAGGISNVATTCNVSAGQGALFPQPSNPGDYFIMTFTDAATGDVHEIVHVTGRTGDTMTIVRAQEGTAAQNWLAGDFAEELHTAGAMQAMEQLPDVQAIIRTRLTGNTTYYVNVNTGNNGNDGLTSGTAFATIQHAASLIENNLDLAGFIVTVRVAAGTYSAGWIMQQSVVGGAGPSSVVFEAIDGSVIINGGVNWAVSAQNGAQFSLEGNGWTLAAPGGTFAVVAAIVCQTQSAITITGDVSFQQSRDADIYCAIGSVVEIISTVTMNVDYTGGGAVARFWAGPGGLISMLVTVVDNLVGSPTYGNGYAYATETGVIEGAGFSFTGAGTVTGPRYEAFANGVITVAGRGGSVFPGSSGGTTSLGGQYG